MTKLESELKKEIQNKDALEIQMEKQRLEFEGQLELVKS